MSELDIKNYTTSEIRIALKFMKELKMPTASAGWKLCRKIAIACMTEILAKQTK